MASIAPCTVAMLAAPVVVVVDPKIVVVVDPELLCVVDSAPSPQLTSATRPTSTKVALAARASFLRSNHIGFRPISASCADFDNCQHLHRRPIAMRALLHGSTRNGRAATGGVSANSDFETCGRLDEGSRTRRPQ